MTSQKTTATGSALDALPEALRHPHVTRFTIEPHPYRPGSHRTQCEYKPFTGTEARPERPAALYELDLTAVQYDGVVDLYDAMLASWAGAQFTDAAQVLLGLADTAWKAWTAADQALTEAYAAFDGLADGTWRASRMALHDLQDTLLKAAADFDDAAAGLARLQESHWDDLRKSIGEITGYDLAASYHDVATKLGISTKGWQIGDVEDYRYSWSTRTLTSRTQTTVAEQNERLNRAAKDISDAGEGVLGLVDGIRAELDTVRAERDQAVANYRAQIDRMLETIDGLADDLTERALERDEAEHERDEAITKLESEDPHTDCAWIEDLEAAKASITTTTKERNEAREAARLLRTQRTIILAGGSVIVLALVLAVIVVGGYGS